MKTYTTTTAKADAVGDIGEHSSNSEVMKVPWKPDPLLYERDHEGEASLSSPPRKDVLLRNVKVKDLLTLFRSVILLVACRQRTNHLATDTAGAAGASAARYHQDSRIAR